jgi:hypothetical protein
MTTTTQTGRWTKQVIGGTVRRTWHRTDADEGVIAYTTWTTPRTGEGDPGERFHEYTVVVEGWTHLLYREDGGDVVTNEDGMCADDHLAALVLGFTAEAA